MIDHIPKAYIATDPEHCRMCYTCVRECPSKAIRILEGQAEVIPERCIACGNCVRVCSQNAKRTLSTKAEVMDLLAAGGTVAAIVAPSFPAEFTECRPKQFVGMLQALGFDLVSEVAFGADLVARAYRELLEKDDGKSYIGTSCPAIVGYVERYHPDLVEKLAPIVSPMVAQARVMRRLHGDSVKIVFVGPCIAKKVEAGSRMIPNEVDAAITFRELRKMFEAQGVTPLSVEPVEFDPPHPGAGSVFPIGGGLLQAAGIAEDIVEGEVVSASGHKSFPDALREFSAGGLDIRLLELLCCPGCTMGPGMDTKAPRFKRRACVSRYVRERMEDFDKEAWEGEMARFADLDLTRRYVPHDQRIAVPARDDLKTILQRLGKFTPEDELNCGACGYETCHDHAIAIHKGLAEIEMCLPYTIDKLKETVVKLEQSSSDLAVTQEALMHSERLASMGQLAAGIAHEVNNPLGVVLMYAHLLLDDLAENAPGREDLAMIAEQADRCKKIVSGLLNFARQNKVMRQPADIRKLADRCLQTVAKPDKIEVVTNYAADDPIVEVDADQVTQVLNNLVSNAYAAMPDGGELRIEIEGDADRVTVRVADNGSGIAEENRGKIFEPFFTTKQIGKGTGLGLSVTYGIVKMHKGDIRFETNADPSAGPTGTTFVMTLPRRGEE